MWHSFFDKIFLISLDHLKTSNFRLPTAKAEIERFGIPYEVYNAEFDVNGVLGCFLTYKNLFYECFLMNYKNVLVFEDDIKAIAPFEQIHHVLDIATYQLPTDYHTLHLGPNTHCALQRQINTDLLQMHQCRSTHAQAYSIEAMKQIVSYEWTGTPIDQLIEERLQPQGKCFCTYPLLVTQRNGFSDIDKRDVNMYYIEERFEQHTKHLR